MSNSQSANSTSWIPELCLTTTEQGFILNGEPICDRIIDSAMSLLHRQNPCLFFQSTAFNYTLLQYCPHQPIHIHHDQRAHFITTANSADGSVKIYDSLNLPPSQELIQQIK